MVDDKQMKINSNLFHILHEKYRLKTLYFAADLVFEKTVEKM
jgi:hypothetical protein